MIASRLPTLRDILRETISRFNTAHIDSPATTARVVLARALDKPREWLVAHDDATLDAPTAARVEHLIKQVLAHEPLAYILGSREFYGIDLMVDPRVLIPRPETEMLVELALGHLRAGADMSAGRPTAPDYAMDDVVDVIDVGTGSGAVAIAISRHAPDARIIASDISVDALAVARINALSSKTAGQITFIASDLLDGINAQARVITANLPYVTTEEIESLPPEIQEHEPRVALDGGDDGLHLVRRLLRQLDAHLLPGGIAVFEFGSAQGKCAVTAAREVLGGWSVELLKDLAGLDRVLLARKPEIQLIAVDLDGTTLDDHFRISERVKRALRAAVERGVRVTIASGRPVPVIAPYIEAIGVNAPVLAMQGGMIYDFAIGQVLHELTITRELGCALVALEHLQPAWQIVLFIGDHMVVSSLRYAPEFYLSLLGENLTVQVDLCAALAHNDPDKVLVIVSPEDAPLAIAEMGRIAGEDASVVQSHRLFVEVNPRDAHKGFGLARLAAGLNIARESVMAIGDQDNDTTMVAWAGVGVAMGNGSPATRAAANWIAPSIDQDGAAVAIERFVLGW